MDKAKVTALPAGAPLLLAAGMMGLFLAALEQTVLGPAMGGIAADLGGGPLLPWVATAYLVTATAGAPILSALADVIGRRPALMISLGLFVLGSVIAATAPGLPALVAGRAVQGAGAGGLSALPFVIIGDLVPMARRATFSAWISTIFAAASALGPLAGGILIDRLDWTAVFWLNLPLGLLIALGVLAGGATGAGRRQRRVDALGAALLAGAIAATLLGVDRLTSAGAASGWVLLLAGMGLFPLFVRRMARAPDPLVPVKVMTEPTIALNALGLMCTQGANIGLAVWLPLYWQHAFDLTAAETGRALMGMLAGIVVAAYVPPRILLRHPHYRPIVRAGAGAGVVCALGLMAGMAMQAPLGVQVAAAGLLGACWGMMYPNFTLATQNAARDGQNMGAAIGVLAFMRAMGGTIGASATGIVAVGAGLAGTAGGWPVWLLAAPAAVLMAICLMAGLAMADHPLVGYAVRRPARPAAGPGGG